MKTKNYILGAATFLLSTFQLNAQTVSKDYQDGKLWVKIKSDYKDIVKSINDNSGIVSINNLPFLKSINEKYHIKHVSVPFAKAKMETDLKRVYEIEITDIANIDEAIKLLSKQKGVEFAEKIPLHKPCLTPNDPSYSTQWALTKINAAGAWNYFSTGSTIVVAVVDGGVQTNHPDLTANIWVNAGEIPSNGIDDDANGYIDDVNGWDMADNDNNPNPTNTDSHGTHVAGIVGATTNNGIGIASIGFSVKIQALKSGNTPSSLINTIDGVLYAADNGAKVINMSYGSPGSSTVEQTVMDYAYNKGVVLIAAAGNDNNSAFHYPAAYNHVISVAATTSGDAKASFSSYGAWVDISAPGNNIYSTVTSSSYGNKNGTSMASPMVAGLAGLMLSLNPYLTPDDIETCLKNNVDNIDAFNPSYLGQLGAGRINANNTMQCVQSSLTWAPVANFSANTTTISAGGSVNFSNLSLYNPTTYTWTFQGGSIATSNSASPPSITYNTPGTYSVSLKVSNSNGNNTKTQLAYIVVNPAASCNGINFPAPASWSATNYYYGTAGASGWINGVGLNNDKQKAMYFDASTQSSTILQNVLIAFSFANSGNLSKIVPVHVYDGTSGTPGALLGTSNLTMNQINADAQSGYYTDVSFVNNPITLPTSKKFFVSVDLINLSWSAFPKDTLAIVSNLNGQTVPSAIWEQQSSGTWKKYGTAGSWAINASLFIHPFLTTQATNATFTTSAISICQGNYINYDPTGSTYQNGLSWSLQGASAIGSNTIQPQVLYNTPGTFISKLYVKGGGCSLIDSAQVSVTVKANPVLSITSSSLTVCPGNTVSLAGSGAVTYTWSPATFLNVTNGANVISTPTTNISYNVSATAANGCQANSSLLINVDQAPTVSVTTSSVTICPGQSVTFDATLSSNINTFAWSAPGASSTTSSLVSPTFTYNTAGTYTVTLNAANTCSTNNSYTKVITVGQIPIVSVTSSTTSICVGQSVSFNASSSTNVNTYNWSATGASPSTSSAMSPTFTYNTPGTYTVTLSAVNSCSTNNSYTKVITVGQIPAVSVTSSSTSICAGQSVSFNASTSTNVNTYNWSATGASPATSNAVAPSFIYNTAGTYTVTLSATNSCSTNNTYSKIITVNALPVVSATSSTASICAGQSVSFNASTSTNVTTYNWSATGALPSTSSAVSPTFTYNTPGTYTVSLSAVNSCSTNNTFVQVITVGSSPVVSVTSSSTSICAGQSVSFNASSSTNVNTYNWSATGASPATSNAVSPSFTYNTPGTYTVSLSAVNSCSTNSTFVQVIAVGSSPIVSVTSSSTSICAGQSVSFDASASSNVNTYNWSAVGASPSISSVVSPSFTFNVAGTYTVFLSATNNCLTNNTYSQIVTVGCTGIELNKSSNFSVVYSTVNHSLLLNNNYSGLNTLIQLYDLLGKEIMTKKVTNGEREIELPTSITEGIYVVRVANNITEFNSKVFIRN